MSRRIESEEEIIARYLAPLCEGFPGAGGLKDDCATLAPPAGAELVLTMDAVAEGVHFRPGDPARDIGWKALAVNVSDLAGKGADPMSYLMALSFPEPPEEAWLEEFCSGLAEGQAAFGIVLTGGDTDRRPGPITVTITAVGSVQSGAMVPRTRMGPQDEIFVSGTLGDGALGLKLLENPGLAATWGLSAEECAFLVGRYRRPQPRLALGQALRAAASAAMDVSDGLAKDLARMCAASGAGASIESARLPLSAPARKALAAYPALLATILSGGDDYEILASVASDRAEEFLRLAAASGVPVTRIGESLRRPGVRIRSPDGATLPLSRPGWDHFGA